MISHLANESMTIARGHLGFQPGVTADGRSPGVGTQKMGRLGFANPRIYSLARRRRSGWRSRRGRGAERSPLQRPHSTTTPPSTRAGVETMSPGSVHRNRRTSPVQSANPHSAASAAQRSAGRAIRSPAISRYWLGTLTFSCRSGTRQRPARCRRVGRPARASGPACRSLVEVLMRATVEPDPGRREPAPRPVRASRSAGV